MEKLIELCDEYFLSYMVKPYAGARSECLYCGATEVSGKVDHSYSDCPITKYKEIKTKILTEKIITGELP